MNTRRNPVILLLDVSFVPIRAISRQKAWKLHFLGKAEFLTQALMKLHRSVPIRPVCETYAKWYVFARDDNTCQYCGKRLSRNERTIDHVIPVKKGGSSSFDNCVTACRPCNTRKGCETLQSVGYSLLKKPSVPRTLDILRFRYKELFQNFETYFKEICNAP